MLNTPSLPHSLLPSLLPSLPPSSPISYSVYFHRTGEEKYSHLKLGIKAPFHSGAFFKTLNYSFLEEGCDEAQSPLCSNGMFPCSAGQPALRWGRKR